MTRNIRLFAWTALGCWSPLAALLAGLADCNSASSTFAADGGPTAPASPSDAGASSGPKGTVLGAFGTPPLFALWGSGSQDIWLVGGTEQNIDPGLTPGFDGAPGPPPGGRIVHFQGKGWSDVQAPSPFALFAVWGSAANDIWAGGGDGIVSGSGVVLHYDGMAWSQVSQLKDYVSAIWGSSSTDVWFAGGLSIWHWNGTAIAPVPAPKPPDTLLTLWGFSASDAWVGGANGGLMHWDGSSWNPIATNGLYIYGLWGASPTDLWGVGNDGYQLHWDGTTVKNTTQGFTAFNAIHGVSGGDIWALGSCCWEDGGRSASLGRALRRRSVDVPTRPRYRHSVGPLGDPTRNVFRPRQQCAGALAMIPRRPDPAQLGRRGTPSHFGVYRMVRALTCFACGTTPRTSVAPGTARKTPKAARVQFARRGATRAVVCPGGDGGPVVTLMLPDEIIASRRRSR
jgi:hypothetical protein